jgi:hypothetical protein
MADQILTLKNIEEYIWTLETTLLGYDPTNSANASKVRRTWNPQGQPAFAITDNVAFFRVSPAPDEISLAKNAQYSDLNTTTSNRNVQYTRVHEIQFTFYGPLSYDNADKVQAGLFLQSSKEYMAKKNLYLMTNIDTPVRVPELYNEQWWDRTDFRATYYENVIRTGTVSLINSFQITMKH